MRQFSTVIFAFGAVALVSASALSAPDNMSVEADANFSAEVLGRLNAGYPKSTALTLNGETDKLFVASWIAVRTRSASWLTAEQGATYRGLMLAVRGRVGTNTGAERCYEMPANAVRPDEMKADYVFNFGTSRAVPGVRLAETFCPPPPAPAPVPTIAPPPPPVPTIAPAAPAPTSIEMKSEKFGVAFPFALNAVERAGIYTVPNRDKLVAAVGLPSMKVKSLEDTVALVSANTARKNLTIVSKQKLPGNRFLVVSTDDTHTNITVVVNTKKGPVVVLYDTGKTTAEQEEVTAFAVKVRAL